MAKARPVTGIDAHASTGENARRIARTRLEEMESWGQYADDPQRIHELHNLRIAAKRLRYTLEIFADVLPQETASMLEEITQIQEELGTLHDSDVMIDLIRLCLASHNDGNGASKASKKHAPLSRSQQQIKDRAIADPDLVTYLVNSHDALSQEERRGLERFQLLLQQRRAEQYNAFRQHWHQLEECDFQQKLLSILDA